MRNSGSFAGLVPASDSIMQCYFSVQNQTIGRIVRLNSSSIKRGVSIVGVLTLAFLGLFHISIMILKSKYCLLVLVWISFYSHAAAIDKDQFFIESNTFFQLNVADGLVRYKQIKKNDDKLKKLVSYVSLVDLSKYNPSEKLAFYINAYNVLVISQIIHHYPIDSPMSLPGFFDQKKHLIAGEELTLNDLENERIRVYNDPRIHFVLVCAALGCPKLANFSYVPDQLDEQLTQQTKLALNDPDFLQIDGGIVKISEIFSWYATDFGKNESDLITFIKKYRDDVLPEKLKLSYYTYNWKLNESN